MKNTSNLEYLLWNNHKKYNTKSHVSPCNKHIDGTDNELFPPSSKMCTLKSAHGEGNFYNSATEIKLVNRNVKTYSGIN